MTTLDLQAPVPTRANPRQQPFFQPLPYYPRAEKVAPPDAERLHGSLSREGCVWGGGIELLLHEVSLFVASPIPGPCISRRRIAARGGNFHKTFHPMRPPLTSPYVAWLVSLAC